MSRGCLSRMEGIVRRILSVMPVLLLVISAVVLFSSRNNSTTHSQIRSAAITAHNYRYYILKGPGGFVLARAARGPHGEPAETPQPLAPLGNGFGQYETDSVGSIQLSPDGQYLAIDGVREGGAGLDLRYAEDDGLSAIACRDGQFPALAARQSLVFVSPDVPDGVECAN